MISKIKNKISNIKLSKSKLLILSIAIIALLCTVIGGTVAWLSSTPDPIVNTFTYGDINITLTETDTKDDENLNTNTYEMIPGNKITKDPLITVKENSEDCYLFVKIEKTANFDEFMEYRLLENWILLDGTENVYYQEVIKSTEKQDFYVIKDNTVTVKESVTKRMLNELNRDGVENYPQMTITAYAVQRDSGIEAISTASKAWSLVSEQA